MLFHSRKVLGHIYEVLASYAYKLPVRRFLLDLFSIHAKAKAAIPNHTSRAAESGMSCSPNS